MLAIAPPLIPIVRKRVRTKPVRKYLRKIRRLRRQLNNLKKTHVVSSVPMIAQQ